MFYLTESLFPRGQSCREMCMSHSKSRDNLEVPVEGWCILAPAAVSFKVTTSLSNLLNFRQIFAILSVRFMTCQGKHMCVKEVDLVYLLSLSFSDSTKDISCRSCSIGTEPVHHAGEWNRNMPSSPEECPTSLTTSLGCAGTAHSGQSVFLLLWGISLFLLKKKKILTLSYIFWNEDENIPPMCSEVTHTLSHPLHWLWEDFKETSVSEMTQTTYLRWTVGVSKPDSVCASQGTPHPPKDLPRMILAALLSPQLSGSQHFWIKLHPQDSLSPQASLKHSFSFQPCTCKATFPLRLPPWDSGSQYPLVSR